MGWFDFVINLVCRPWACSGLSITVPVKAPKPRAKPSRLSASPTSPRCPTATQSSCPNRSNLASCVVQPRSRRCSVSTSRTSSCAVPSRGVSVSSARQGSRWTRWPEWLIASISFANGVCMTTSCTRLASWRRLPVRSRIVPRCWMFALFVIRTYRSNTRRGTVGSCCGSKP